MNEWLEEMIEWYICTDPYEEDEEEDNG